MEITLLILLPLLIWTVILYNKLVRDKNYLLAAWSDTQTGTGGSAVC